MGKSPYEMIFAPEIADHLNAIDVKYHVLRLSYEECVHGRGEIAI